MHPQDRKIAWAAVIVLTVIALLLVWDLFSGVILGSLKGVNWEPVGVVVSLVVGVVAITVSAYVAFRSERTAKAQLRAFISVESDEIQSFSTQKRPFTKLKLNNIGTTPAFDTRSKSWIEPVPHPLPDNYQFPKVQIDWVQTGTIFPHQEIELRRTASRNFSQQEITDICAESKKICVYAVVFYKDIFDQEHYTEYARLLNADAQVLGKFTNATNEKLKVFWSIIEQHNNAT